MDNIRHNVALKRPSREEGNDEDEEGSAAKGEAVRVKVASIDWADASAYPPAPLDFVA